MSSIIKHSSGGYQASSRQHRTAITIFVLVVTAALVSADAIAAPDWTDHCPSTCKCKWISGKKTAICREAGLTTVPNSLNSDIQVLDINGNPIPVLSKDIFRSVGLLNLQKIYLRGCGIKEINPTAFRDLTILIEVDLSSNSLSFIDTKTFMGNNRLRVLDMSGNPLNELREEQFPPLPHLRTLEMKSCRLKHVHKRAFVNLAALETLNLSNNKLKYLTEAVFAPLIHIKSLSLDGNPWLCDCHLRDFKEWFLKSKLFSLALACTEPEKLKGIPWGEIEPTSFSCAPKVDLSETMVQGEVGGNASFGCLVRGDPEPRKEWIFNGHPINMNGSDPNVLIEEDLSGWMNVTLSNMTDLYVGEYSCVAENKGGKANKNLTLLLPEVKIATTLSKAESWLLMAGLVAGGAGTVVTALTAGMCLCLCSRQRRKKSKRKSKLTGSVSYTEQEKKLLDCSITERASGTVSFEGMSQTDMELLTRDPSTVDLSEPVHITIENLPHDIMNNAIASSSGGTYHGSNGAAYVIPPPLSTQQQIHGPQQSSILPRGALAPPPEFSSALPASTFGNIFISVKDPNLSSPVNQDDITRYPDLLDLPHRSKGSGPTSASGISVTAGSERPPSIGGPYHHHGHHHHTLALHHHHGHHSHVHLHNIIHHQSPSNQFYQAHQDVPRCCAGSVAQIYSGCDQCVPEAQMGDAMLAAACATLPRRPRTNSAEGGKYGTVNGATHLVRVRPHYDTVGPRVTASGGSGSVLSLPEVSMEEEEAAAKQQVGNKNKKSEKCGIMNENANPSQPPMCTSLPPEFVSL